MKIVIAALFVLVVMQAGFILNLEQQRDHAMNMATESQKMNVGWYNVATNAQAQCFRAQVMLRTVIDQRNAARRIIEDLVKEPTL